MREKPKSAIKNFQTSSVSQHECGKPMRTPFVLHSGAGTNISLNSNNHFCHDTKSSIPFLLLKVMLFTAV